MKFTLILKRLSVLFAAIVVGQAASPADVPEPSWKAKSGPWGELTVHTIYLEAPDALLATIAKPNSVTRWVFEQTTAASVRASLVQAGIPAATLEHLFAPGRHLVGGNVVSLYPDLDDLLALSPETRNAVYSELAKVSANEFCRDPVFIIGGDLDDWLSDTKLNPTQQAAFRKLIWRRGEVMVFSDIPVLLALARGEKEVQEVFRAITRVRSLLVELSVPLKGDRQEFLDYWSAGQTDAPRLAFLRAISLRHSPQSVDITHFLPTLMRQRAYTFPDMELGLKGRFPDCHWTSLNFFNQIPQDYYLDTRLAANHLTQNYQTVEAPYKYGDVLCFLDGGEGLHTCVYIADDMVLTKNGDGILAPWVLMQIKDVSAIYRRSPNTRIQGYRLKR